MKTIILRVFLCVSLLFIPTILLNKAQSQYVYAVSGIVKEKDTNVPLEGVSVQVKGYSFGTITNADGYYRLPGNFAWQTLVYSHVGYITQEVLVTLPYQIIDVTLEPDLDDE